jgi:hypothetical protein
MTALQKLEANERKIELIESRGGRCEVCGKQHPNLQLAHRIPKGYVDVFGEVVIHHPLNIVVTCPGNCNDSVLMKPATQPVRAKKLIERIRTALDTGVIW